MAFEAYTRAPGARDLQVFPEIQLEGVLRQLDAVEPELEVRTRVTTYIESLKELGADDELVALIGHAIVSYLDNCLIKCQPWAARFLFPPALDPTEVPLNGGDVPAVEYFKEQHMRRNLEQASQAVADLVFDDTILFINGPMFSAKSGAAALMYGLLRQSIGKKNVTKLIFSGMGEKTIHARSLPNRAIKAKPVDMLGLRKVVNKLLEHPTEAEGVEGKRVVIIEEATFFVLEDREIACEFVSLINQLKQNGISVILIGLGKNYLGLDLLITETLLAECPDIQRLDCTSFHLYPTPEGNQVASAELTGRYSQTLQMFDWCFPVLVPRALAHGITYCPMPADFHPMDVIHNLDPELFERLRVLHREDLLQRHTELTLQQEA